MGLRYASVRQPHVVVMAPALTETGQPQGFHLKSGTLSSPVSLISFNDNAKGDLNYNIKCPRTNNSNSRELGMNGELDKLAELQTVSSSPALCTSSEKLVNKNSVKSCEVSNQSVTKESDYSLLQIGGFMMNNSCTAPGDEDNMGLQKSGHQLNSLDSCNYLKMDLFKSLNANTLPQGDLGGGDLGHNVDEIMQVIKNMESKGNDIEENLDSSLQISDANDIAGGLSTFEREFLNDVAMMCVDENLGESSLAVENRNTVIRDKVNEAQDRQFKIERKCEWLLRRLYKIQARTIGKHASEEMTGMLQNISSMLQDNNSPTKCSPLYSALTSTKEDSQKMLREVSRHNSSLSLLTKKLHQTSQQQAVALSQHHVSCKYFGSGSHDSSSSVANRQIQPTLSGLTVPKFSSEVKNEVESVSGQLHFQLKFIESGIDSDATASSSGGESCDEAQNFNNQQQQNLSISKRASWKWAQDRGSIGSRWSWLQAQISDLEYRIRQTNELQRQIRTGKGGVSLAGDDPPKVCDSVVVNGYHGALPGTNSKSVDSELVSESSCRTRPLVRSSFRKRKLFQTAGLHLTNKKAAKPSSVPCGCCPPLSNCVLCTGRPQPTQQFEDVDLLSVNERIGLLDPAFHPVLSFQSEVSQSLHFDAVMKTTEWQMKCHRLQLKAPALLRVMEQTEDSSTTSSETPPKTAQSFLLEPHQRRRYFRRSTATALSEKIKRKLTKKKRQKMLGDSNNFALERLKTRRRFSSHQVPGSASPEDRGSESQQTDEDGPSESASPAVGVSGAARPSPAPSPTAHCSKERGDAFRRKRENSYDIDNIVIPYSVAAATRLEKLQYKEILTPKWRVQPVEPLPKLETKNNNGLIRRPSQEDGDAEDLTEEMLVSRHERCEQEERKKFSTYLKLPNSMNRPRVHRRADSRAESSGGNTPDPMSPAAADGGGGGGGSDITSPPATPQPAVVDKETAASEERYNTRRRTVSSRCASPAEGCHDEVAPYELRTFPLTDDTYEKMLKVMPPDHPFKAYNSSHQNSSNDSESESRPLTPLSDSTESADTYLEDDPNDPEWTVDESSSERVPFKR